MANIRNLDGAILADGLQGCIICDEAIIAACNLAKDQNKPVILDDDDGVWLINPDGSAEEFDESQKRTDQ